MPTGFDATLDLEPARTMVQETTGHETARHERAGQGDGTSALTLLFRAGERPDADTIARIVAAAGETGLPASVSHRPGGEAQWLELLASGLTFDLTGLAPGVAARGVDPQQVWGFEGEAGTGTALQDGEALELIPSGHIVAGAGLQPVLRTMLGLAANLVMELPVLAVGWGPADTAMEPRYFCRSVMNWLGGGAFPALGLTALLTAPDGSVASRGLAQFTGQEMQLEGLAGEAPADTAKLALRVIDRLVRNGRLDQPVAIDAGDQVLMAEPSQVGRLVLVWREGHG